MADYRAAFVKLMSNEGGYANDPQDLGGETYKGIASKFYPKWEGWSLINIAKTKPNFPKSLDQDETLQMYVFQFYKLNYWDKMRGDKILSFDIAFTIFDFMVNAGEGIAIKLAQKTVGTVEDGVIGDHTLLSLNEFPVELFIYKYAFLKIEKYCNIVEKNASQLKYFYGWVRRVIHNKE
jgi:lysozyme family protein